MKFVSWCAYRTDRLRHTLDDAAYRYERALMVWEHNVGWWAQYRENGVRAARETT